MSRAPDPTTLRGRLTARLGPELVAFGLICILGIVAAAIVATGWP